MDGHDGLGATPHATGTTFRVWAAFALAVFVHPVRRELTASPDSDRNMAELRDAITHRYGADALDRVIYTESHDEVANGHRRLPEEISPANADDWYARKRSTLGAALVFTAPGIPMVFQGQELLEDR